MAIICPSCREQLAELGSSGKFFRCPNESVLWEICRDLSGDYVKAYYIPPAYEGPMMGRVEEIQAGERQPNGK